MCWTGTEEKLERGLETRVAMSTEQSTLLPRFGQALAYGMDRVYLLMICIPGLYTFGRLVFVAGLGRLQSFGTRYIFSFGLGSNMCSDVAGC